MNWERVGKFAYQFILTIIEWGFKLCAFVACWLALGAQGSFGDKLGAGFGSLPESLRQIIVFPSTFSEMSWAAREYHQIGGAEFQEAYGIAPIDQLVSTINGLFMFFHQVSTNLSEAPFITLLAGILAFFTFYLLGRIIRFARQKGRGSWLCRFEQRLGDRVFARKPTARNKVVQSGNKQSSIGKTMKKMAS